MPDWLIAVVMGIVEGVTEFLPISSTGHLIVVGELIGLPPELENTFEIVIQIGAVLAVVGFYWADLFHQLKTVRTDQNVQRLWLGVIIAFIPAAVIGLLLKDIITRLLFSPIPIGIALIAGGIVFIVIERMGLADKGDEAIELEQVTIRQALTIGLFQTLALIPGMSRSGASIVGGLFAGLNRKVATQFSFYLAIPTLGAATLYELVQNLSILSADNISTVFIGIVVSGVVAWLSIGWLLRYISSNTFTMFGYYRIIAGMLIILFFSLR